MDVEIAQGAEQISDVNPVFKYIELQLFWRGKLNANDLMAVLAVSRQTASKAIRSYKETYPDALKYDAQKKRYEPTETFRPEITTSSFDEYVALFHGTVTDQNYVSNLPGSHRSPDPHIVTSVLSAIEKQQRLDVSYASLSSPEFEERIIAPHALISDGIRWHIRAWCEKNLDYRDFVLTRIRDIHGIEGGSAHLQDTDEAWNTQLTLSIEPDPRLSPDCQKIVAMDYDMSSIEGGRFKRSYRVRAAMVLYWLQRLRLDRYSDRAEAQQIILSQDSICDVERWTN